MRELALTRVVGAHELPLTHYTDEPEITLPGFTKFIEKFRNDPAWEMYLQRDKPVGMWVSVDGEMDWKQWCEESEFHLERLRYEHRIHIKRYANILVLTTPEDLLAFTKEYRMDHQLVDGYEMNINWVRVMGDYDGIVIVPYQWELRLDDRTAWYYGWDCASGCIWNPEAIERIEHMNPPEQEEDHDRSADG